MGTGIIEALGTSLGEAKQNFVYCGRKVLRIPAYLCQVVPGMPASISSILRICGIPRAPGQLTKRCGI
ncbi:MAG TPA: hypothetical protein VFC58_07505 [Desulfosporosinus sp.]|nr:hypothetical protein [Desulfosporosinus sp.]